MNNQQIIERMKKVSGSSEDQELAKILGLGKTAVANWKRGTSINLSYLIDFGSRYGCDLHWLITGEEQNTLTTHEKMVLLAFNDLDERQKLDALGFMTGLKNGGGVAGVDQSNNFGGINQFVSK